MSLSKEAKELLKNNAEEVKEIVNTYTWGAIGNWTKFIELHTYPPVRFKDFHGNEVSDGEDYWIVMEDYVMYKSKCDHTSGKDSLCKYFSTEQAAKDWIELNKPEFSVQDVIDWLGDENESIHKEAKQELLELIKAKKQQP